MLALCLLVYKCLLNEKRLSGVFLPVLRPLPPRVTGFSLVAAGRTKGLETRARLPCREARPQLSGHGKLVSSLSDGGHGCRFFCS
ncbi:MAG: hypothetical protein ACLT2T_07395 [Bilophila wadsworthia]